MTVTTMNDSVVVALGSSESLPSSLVAEWVLTEEKESLLPLLPAPASSVRVTLDATTV